MLGKAYTRTVPVVTKPAVALWAAGPCLVACRHHCLPAHRLTVALLAPHCFLPPPGRRSTGAWPSSCVERTRDEDGDVAQLTPRTQKLACSTTQAVSSIHLVWVSGQTGLITIGIMSYSPRKTITAIPSRLTSHHNHVLGKLCRRSGTTRQITASDMEEVKNHVQEGHAGLEDDIALVSPRPLHGLIAEMTRIAAFQPVFCGPQW